LERLEGRKLLRRPQNRWADNIKIDPKEMGWYGMRYIYLVYDREE
jgi:hypothetical protein